MSPARRPVRPCPRGPLAALTLGGMVWTGSLPTGSRGVEQAFVAEVFAIINLVFLALAAAMALEVPRPRRGERFPVHRPDRIDLGDEEDDFPCVVLNISETGALLGNGARLIRASIDLDIPGIGILPAEVIRCTESNVAVEFSGTSDDQRLESSISFTLPAFATR